MSTRRRIFYRRRVECDCSPDIARRWSDILINGMKEEIQKQMIKSYTMPDNLILASAPALVPEIKATISANSFKRDRILAEKQNILSSGITCLASAIPTILADDSLIDHTKNYIVKSLSDTSRLLCQIHYSKTQTRWSFVLARLNKEM